MRASQKVSYAIQRPGADRQPHVVLDPASKDRRLRLDISILDLDGPWGWKKIRPEQLGPLQEKLAHFGMMTWRQVSEHKNSGPIRLRKLVEEARRRLSRIRQDDGVDQLYHLRIGSRERVWGIRDRDVLKVLWWDPNHTVYERKR